MSRKKMTKIEKLRNDTYDEAVDILNTYGRCCIVRPTGFGKTGILTRFLKSGNYQNMLYLYPAEVILDTVLNFYYDGNVPEDRSIPNVTFMTYAKLVRLNHDDMEELSDIDLIVVDECHKLGATQTVRAMTQLLGHCEDAHLLGATASPDRMDLIDEISIFFNNRVVSQYTLHDAFTDGILQKPYYCFCSYGATDDIQDVKRDAMLEIDEIQCKKDRENAKELLRSRLIEISEISKMDNIIRDTCNNYAVDNSYMKFIVFFSSFAHIRDQMNQVKGWFQDAYPTHNVRELIITSENAQFSSNVSRLDECTYTTNTIDLICTCNMMNQGYHVDDITGILMYRGTTSDIIFLQQLGRVLSSGVNTAGIVFDVVDNLHRESAYDVLGDVPKITKERKKRYENLLEKVSSNDTLTDEEFRELESLTKVYDNPEPVDRWWVNANQLEPEDLIATGYEATYKELIAKAVCEPISMRCRQAYEYWLDRGGDDSSLQKLIDLEASIRAGKPDQTQVPLSPFARLKKVSLNAVMREVFGTQNDYEQMINDVISKKYPTPLVG